LKLAKFYAHVNYTAEKAKFSTTATGISDVEFKKSLPNVTLA